MNGPVIALGTFDGVHLGHRKVMVAAIRLAKKLKTFSLLITFDPHPQQFIRPQRGLKLLTTLSERIELISRSGIDYILIIRFDRSLQNLSYEKFIQKYLVKRLKTRQVCVGYDFAFGKARAGHLENLKKLGKKFNFKIEIVKPVKIGSKIIKSSRIRKLLSQGDILKSNQQLGYAYSLSGKVVRGHRRGRYLGFPTANLEVDPHKLVPAHGVYAGEAYFKNQRFKCAISIGDHPTFSDGKTTIEAYLLNCRLNLWGQTLKIEFIKWLRNEIQFADVEELKKQIFNDIKKVAKL